jgi:hypothetical protein
MKTRVAISLITSTTAISGSMMTAGQINHDGGLDVAEGDPPGNQPEESAFEHSNLPATLRIAQNQIQGGQGGDKSKQTGAQELNKRHISSRPALFSLPSFPMC